MKKDAIMADRNVSGKSLTQSAIPSCNGSVTLFFQKRKLEAFSNIQQKKTKTTITCEVNNVNNGIIDNIFKVKIW